MTDNSITKKAVMNLHFEIGREVLVNGDWYPIIGTSMVYRPDGTKTGSIFTLKPRGHFEPCLGYRVDVSEVEDIRAGADNDR